MTAMTATTTTADTTEQQDALRAACRIEQETYRAYWGAMIAYAELPTPERQAASLAARDAHYDAREAVNRCKAALGYYGVSRWTGDPRKGTPTGTHIDA